MSGNTISMSETRIDAISLQSSAYGVTLALLYGVNRVAGNLIWYGGFKAIPNTTSQAGKGGTKTQNTTFAYTASVMMGLVEGQITGISRGWKGKQLYSGGALPLAIITATQAYSIPGGGGTLTVTNSATFSANISVVGTIGSGDAFEQRTLSEGSDYTRVGGVYTFLVGGFAVTVTYQYTTGGYTQTALQAMGLSFAGGALGQAPWSYLTTNFASQAIGYSGLAYVYAQDYSLGTGAQVENHTFEVQGPQAYSVSTTVPDANPCTATMDALINGRYGAAFPSNQLGPVTAWSTYCLASGILMSPLLETQMQAAEFVTTMAKLTNTAVVWSAGLLKMIPYGDTSLTGNGATYTPNVTPIYDLTDDDFLRPPEAPRKAPADAYNHIRVEFLNRDNLYNVEIAEAKDSANIDIYGLRSAEILRAHWICDAVVARKVAQLIMQRGLYVRNTYEFQLGWTKALLEPMDLVTLTDPLLGTKLPVRITEISESDSGDLDVIAEDFPLGVATSALYGAQAGAGFQHDYNVAPGSVSTPVIFEAPGALTQNGLEVYVAATGVGANWGGCRVWISLDGTSYKLAGTLNGGSRYGTLSAACGASGSIPVTLLRDSLVGGSVADAAALNTLCYIDGAQDEYFAYNVASLTSALNYTLSGSTVRGAYGTTAVSHASGDKFVRVDARIAKSGAIDLGYIGKTIHVKCTSFNIYGAAEESLASVTDYTYAITGWQLLGNAGAAAYSGVVSASSDNILSAGEKPPVILDVAAIAADQAGLDAAAIAYSVTTEKTNYDSAVAALNSYLTTLTSPVAWNNTAGDTTIVGPTFRTKFSDVYAAKQVLQNKLTAVAGTLANWNGIAQVPLDTSNMVRTPTFAATGGVRTWIVGTSAAVTGQPFAYAMACTTRDNYEVYNPIPVKVGERLYFSADMLAQFCNYVFSFGAELHDSSGAVVTWIAACSVLALAPGWQRVTGYIDVPAGVAFFYPWVLIAGSSGFGTGYITNMFVSRAAPGATVGATWGLNVDGSNKPADNASADVTLVNSGAVTIVGNRVVKTGGTNAWDASAYSAESFVGGAFALAAPEINSASIMFGLSQSPTTTASYTDIDFAWFPRSDGVCEIYESGTSRGTFGAYSASDVFMVAYDGTKIVYTRNGVVQRTVSGVASNLRFFWDSSFFNGGITNGLKNIRFVALTPINLGNLPPGNQGGALNSDPGCSDIGAYSLGAVGASIVLVPSGGVIGNTALQMVGSSFARTNQVPLSSSKKYRVSVWCRWTVTGSNSLYLRLHQLNSAGTEIAYSLGIEGVGTSSAWVRYSAIVSPIAGTVAGFASVDSNNSGTGTQQFQDFRIEEVIDTDLIADNAATGVAITTNASFTPGSTPLSMGVLQNFPGPGTYEIALSARYNVSAFTSVDKLLISFSASFSTGTFYGDSSPEFSVSANGQAIQVSCVVTAVLSGAGGWQIDPKAWKSSNTHSGALSSIMCRLTQIKK